MRCVDRLNPQSRAAIWRSAAVSDKGPNCQAPSSGVGHHVDYKVSSNDVTVQLTGIRMGITAGTVHSSSPSGTARPVI